MGVPISPVGGTRTHDPTPPRRGYPPRRRRARRYGPTEGRRRRRSLEACALAGVQRTIQPTLGTTLALAPRRGGSGIGKAFERRADTPNAAPRARRVNDFHWTLGGLFSRNAPSGAGRGAEVFFLSLSLFFARQRWGNPNGARPLPTRRPLRGGAGATHLPSTCKHWQVIVVAPARGGFVFISWRGGAAGLFVSSSTPIYPFNIGRPAAPPRHETQLRASLPSEVASASTLACKQVLPTASCLRPFG